MYFGRLIRYFCDTNIDITLAKQKYYVVWKGYSSGIFESWAECLNMVNGYEGPLYKSFPSKEDAILAYRNGPAEYLGKSAKPLKNNELEEFVGRPLVPSLSVDAACAGNPGVLEYRGVDTKTGSQIFHQGPFPEGTVNIGEFLAIVHGLAYLKQKRSTIPVYSDSKTAIKWVKDKKVNTKLLPNEKNSDLFDLIQRAVAWLNNNSYSNRVLKWETEVWGEIPADFGRK